MKVTKKAGTRVPAPEGTHMAVVIQVIDWGTQEDKFGSRRKIELAFELPDEKYVFNEERGAEPFTVFRKFAMSINKKSDLRAAIEGILGKKLDDEFEMEELLGATCQIQIVHKVDGEYTNEEIKQYMAPPKGFKKKFKINGAQCIVDLDNFDEEAFALLPDWKQEKIKETNEFKAISKPAPKSNIKPQVKGKKLFN